MTKLHGIYTALVTPFGKSKNTIDYNALETLLGKQIEAGVSGVVLLGTTGEAPTVSEEEKFKIVEFSADKIKGTMQILLGINSNSTKTAIEQIRRFESCPIDAFLVTVPPYNKPTEQGLIKHFTKIADTSTKPIVLYNVPGRTGTSLPTKAIEVLSSHPNIIGIKEASGNLTYASSISKFVNDNFVLLSGCDDLTLPLLAIGATGSISVISNIIPKTAIKIINSFESNTSLAQRLNSELYDFYKACFVESNPISIKFMLSKTGIIKNKLRLPMTTLSAKNRKFVSKTTEKVLKIENDTQ